MSPSPALIAARSSYAAALLACVTYGIYFVLAFQCALRVLNQKTLSTTKRSALLAYAVVLFLGQTLYFIGGCKWSAIEFVEAPVDPAVFAGELSSSLSMLKDVMYTMNIWIADSFILYRAYIFWGRSAVFLLPVATYLGTIATGVGLLVETGKPGAVFGQATVINFGTPFWSLSVATNVIATALIAGRLLSLRRAITRLDGRDRIMLRDNTSALVICVESAALYAICAVIYIPLFAINTPIQYPFSALLGGVVSISPTLIMLRMASGIAINGKWGDIALRDIDQDAAVGDLDRDSKLTMDSVQV
ncbi:hypothetical protein EW026_g3416 [Hermanssonia centrifuga]|uniref:Uncharacterized protein n=1 Tax=Hermanssonia centrifuga TaxID=98765 RepID=A0A4S4KLD3_9APHY|nr:hypothetical protein EW026_g3416 [Hermanssonia centrifuga]